MTNFNRVIAAALAGVFSMTIALVPASAAQKQHQQHQQEVRMQDANATVPDSAFPNFNTY